jgi:hypothetical protein
MRAVGGGKRSTASIRPFINGNVKALYVTRATHIARNAFRRKAMNQEVKAEEGIRTQSPVLSQAL